MSAIHGELFTPDEPGEWVTIQQAARRLRIEERVLRRRVTRGDFPSRTHADGRQEVFLPDEENQDTSPDEPEQWVDPERTIDLVDRMSLAVTRQLDAMTVELAASRDRVESLARENGMLTERVSGLERELSSTKEMAERLAAIPAHAANATPSAVEAELASVRRANQRQVEELARMAAELNAFKLEQDEAGPLGSARSSAAPTRSTGSHTRPPAQRVAPWWSTWWIWVGATMIIACFLLIVRLVIG
jgi:hypothetical protein